MMLRFALRSLASRPVRTAVLACGFGFGLAVMAVLLGVGEVILDQAHSPALQGGGDVVISGLFGKLDSGQFVLSDVLDSPEVKPQVRGRSPWKQATVYLRTSDRTWPIAARGGVPSLERSVGDLEIAQQPAWIDRTADQEWIAPGQDTLLRAMDRFHRPPDSPEFGASWAEWLYFNGRSSDGRVRYYLTFLVGPPNAAGAAMAGVRFQLDRDGRQTSYAATAEVDEARVLRTAPDLDIGENRVRLEGSQYHLTLNVAAEDGGHSKLTGSLFLDAASGRSVPPVAIHGARRWLSGYVVPVLSGTVRGALTVDQMMVTLVDAQGYHDHNWGFWQDVRWQWGQVTAGGLSFIYGRVFPPPSVADPSRIPGFLGVLGPAGPVAVSTNVSITESGPDDQDAPQKIVVTAQGSDLDLRLSFEADRSVRTPVKRKPLEAVTPTAFLQLGGLYRVTGRVGGRSIDVAARGAAETFRQR